MEDTQGKISGEELMVKATRSSLLGCRGKKNRENPCFHPESYRWVSNVVIKGGSRDLLLWPNKSFGKHMTHMFTTALISPSTNISFKLNDDQVNVPPTFPPVLSRFFNL